MIEEVPQNMFCISSATENIIMEVPQKLDEVGPVDNRPSTAEAPPKGKIQ